MSDVNPLLAGIKLPGRIFQLPSKGIFYKNGELADTIHNGEIHVRAMSALDEITMKNPDQLFSGAAVNEVFKHCVSGIEDPSQLLSKDVDAIMLFLRAVTYGPDFEFTARHGCPDGKDHSYVANIDELIANMKMIDATMLNDLYNVKLKNGQTVRLKPSIYQHSVDIVRNNQNKNEITADDQKKNFVTMVTNIIDNVDGITEQKFIAEWISTIPSPSVSRIAEKITAINDWGSDLKWKCMCKDCKTEFTIDIPINPISFFTE